MATYNSHHEILNDAIEALKEAKELIRHDCKVAAIAKIDLAIACIKAKREGNRTQTFT